MKNSTDQNKPTLIACRDDESIIKRMKQIGIWEKMNKLSITSETASIINGNELFIWHGDPMDSGYSHFKSSNPVELLLLVAKVFGKPLTSDSQTRH